MNAMLLGNFQPTRLFVIVFLIYIALRMVNPRFAPSMIVGGWIVRTQAPEWVGAPQKHFAWGLGLLLGGVMLYLMVFLLSQISAKCCTRISDFVSCGVFRWM
jgi:hypothetical protein